MRNDDDDDDDGVDFFCYCSLGMTFVIYKQIYK
jgi:hypothetical protein